MSNTDTKKYTVLTLDKPSKYRGLTYNSEMVKEAIEKFKGLKTYNLIDTSDEDLLIHFDKVSHKLVDLYIEGDEVIAEVALFDDTPMGKIFSALADEGFNDIFEMRIVGTGKVKDDVVSDSEIHKIAVLQ